MDEDHTAWYASQHHRNISNLERRQDESLNIRNVNPLIVFSTVLGFQTAKIIMGKSNAIFLAMIFTSLFPVLLNRSTSLQAGE